MTSESTRFLGQPRDTKPTFGGEIVGASSVPVTSIVAGGVTVFQFTNFPGFSGDFPGGSLAAQLKELWAEQANHLPGCLYLPKVLTCDSRLDWITERGGALRFQRCRTVPGESRRPGLGSLALLPTCAIH